MYKCCPFAAVNAFCAWRACYLDVTKNSIFWYKKSSLVKADNLQKHKHAYLDFQLAVRVISLTYITRKLDKVIFGTMILPNTQPFSAGSVCQVPEGDWHSLYNEHFLPRSCPIHWVNSSRGKTKHDGKGKHLIWEKKELWATCAKRESPHFSESLNSNTGWTVTWRLQNSTGVRISRAWPDIWPFVLKGQRRNTMENSIFLIWNC